MDGRAKIGYIRFPNCCVLLSFPFSYGAVVIRYRCLGKSVFHEIAIRMSRIFSVSSLPFPSYRLLRMASIRFTKSPAPPIESAVPKAVIFS